MYFAWVVGCMLLGTAQAQVYRCVQPDGAVKYADEPCGKGERGKEITVQPMTIDASDGRERTQKFLSNLDKEKGRQAEPAPAVSPGVAASSSASQSEGRMRRWERCEPLLDESSGVRRQAIGALCGADLDESMFDTCLAKVQSAQGVGETDAVVRACTGSGLQNGPVVVQPVRPRRVPGPVPCSQWPNDPACAKPMPPAQLGVPDRMGAPARSFKDPQAAPARTERAPGWQDGKRRQTDDTDRR
ncbi:MAG TPA: DUF4124 domain-containing protein [Macromonas sp.]|nr:DUF4124 domain-containing protein [Macromonas sp.]